MNAIVTVNRTGTTDSTDKQNPADNPALNKLKQAVAKAQSARAAQGGPATVQSNETAHVVKRGETLWGIAQKSGNTLSSVVKDNPQIANPGLIHPGEAVFVPNARTQAAPPAGHQAGAPPIRRSSSSSPMPIMRIKTLRRCRRLRTI